MNDAERELLLRAEEQYGVVSLRDALAVGMSEAQWGRRVKQGRLHRVFPGVYRVAGVPRSGLQRAFAASVWLGEDAMVSRLTAATLLRLDECVTRELHVTVPRHVRARSDSTVAVHRVKVLPLVDRTVVDRVPCTTATRTIIDIAAELDEEALEVAFESARRMRLTSTRALHCERRSCAEAAVRGRERSGSCLRISGRMNDRQSSSWR